jgi:2-iminobutanoate/2-iminopropanoate deaminase
MRLPYLSLALEMTNGAARQERSGLYAAGFSPAVVLPNGFVMVSGHVAIGPGGNICGKRDFDAQVDPTLSNLREVLAAAGTKFEQVAGLGIILSDRKYVGRWRELRSRYFREPYPASTLIIAGRVSEELLIEV